MVPRGFPLGDPDYRAVAGQPAVEATAQHVPARLSPDAGTEITGATGGESGRTRPAARVTEGRVLRRIGTGRAPVRSAVLGGALLLGVLGAGIAAWAMTAPRDSDSDQGNITQVDQQSPSTAGPGSTDQADPAPRVNPAAPGADPPTTGANPSPSGDPATTIPAGPDASPANPEPPIPAAPANPESPGAADVITNPDAPPAANLGTATVSAIPPGDVGFGWPSTAFGLPPEPGVEQPAN
jgi:hypothetical protein